MTFIPPGEGHWASLILIFISFVLEKKRILGENDLKREDIYLLNGTDGI